VIVDTETLARAAGLSPSMVRRYAKRGTITPIRARTGRNGRPTYWFDLDTSVTALAKRATMHESDH
jgi:hypothetical protein